MPLVSLSHGRRPPRASCPGTVSPRPGVERRATRLPRRGGLKHRHRFLPGCCAARARATGSAGGRRPRRGKSHWSGRAPRRRLARAAKLTVVDFIVGARQAKSTGVYSKSAKKGRRLRGSPCEGLPARRRPTPDTAGSHAQTCVPRRRVCSQRQAFLASDPPARRGPTTLHISISCLSTALSRTFFKFENVESFGRFNPCDDRVLAAGPSRRRDDPPGGFKSWRIEGGGRGRCRDHTQHLTRRPRAFLQSPVPLGPWEFDSPYSQCLTHLGASRKAVISSGRNTPVLPAPGPQWTAVRSQSRAS